MDRNNLGYRLLQWHSGMSDPVYAIGSFYADNRAYPDKQVADDALVNLERDLRQFRQMERGKSVIVNRFGHEVDLKQFAGYTRKDIRAHIADLREIVAELKQTINNDYDKETKLLKT